MERNGKEDMMQRMTLNTAATVCSLIALAHLVRYFGKVEVRVGQTTIPVAASAPAAILALALGIGLAKEARRS